MNNSKSLKVTGFKQQGFSLIELMISIVISLLIIATALSIFTAVLSTNKNNLASTRLRQDLNAAMSSMARNIRRAGAWNNRTQATVPNPFKTIVIQSAGQCITFFYDKNKDGVLNSDSDPDPNESFGYRLKATDKTIEKRQGGISCDGGGWLDMTDPSLIEITRLEFTKPRPNQIKIALTGKLTEDDQSINIENTITIRNWEPNWAP